MRETTEQFQAQMGELPYVTYLISGTDSIPLNSVTYTAALCPSTFSIGNASSAGFTASYTGSGFPWGVGTQVQLVTQLTNSAGAVLGDVPLGTFTLTRVERQTDTDCYALTGVDAMGAALEETFFCPNPEYPPATSTQVLQALLEQGGLTCLGEELLPETDMALSYDSAGGSGSSMREVVGQLALLAGANAVIDRQGRLAFLRANEVDEVVSADRYYESGLTLEAEDFVFGALTVTATANRETEQGTEETETVYSDQLEGISRGISCTCPYFTQEIFDAVWAAWKGFSFRPGTVSLLGDPRLEVGDKLLLHDRAGDTYPFLVTAVQSTFDGGWRTTLTAAGLEEQGTSAQSQSVSQAITGLKTELGRFKTLYADNLTATRASIDHLTGEDIVGEHGTVNLKEGTFQFGDALSWDGETLQVSGEITGTGGSIGGWTIQRDRLAAQPWRGYDTDDRPLEAEEARMALYPGADDDPPALQFSGFTGSAVIEPLFGETQGELHSLDIRCNGGYVRLSQDSAGNGVAALGEIARAKTMEVTGSLTVGGHTSAVGSVVEDSFSAVSVPSGKLTALGSLALGAGSWVVTCSNYWNSKAEVGVRTLNLSTSSASLQGRAICQEAACGQITRQQVVWVGSASSGTFTLYALAQQDSGIAVDVSGNLCAVRIS